MGPTDPQDVFTLQLRRNSDVTLTLSNTTDRIWLYLLHDSNKNKIEDSGEVIKYAQASHGGTGTIQKSLTKGNYYLRVKPHGSANSGA